MSLAHPYARPDPTLPETEVTGSVEVRTREGAIADGFDAGRLSLDVSEQGRVVRPLTRVAPGLWMFAVSALPGTGADVMQLDVRIDGVSIGEEGTRLAGHRSLPIGGDRWTALGTPRAYGGCTMAPRAAPLAHYPEATRSSSWCSRVRPLLAVTISAACLTADNDLAGGAL